MFNTINYLLTYGIFFVLAYGFISCEEQNTRLVYQLKQPDDLKKPVYEVFSKVIHRHFDGHDYIAIQQETDTFSHLHKIGNIYETLPPSVDSGLVDQYLHTNHTSYSLGYAFQVDLPIKLVSQQELNSYKDWNNFQNHYPRATGIIRFTHPGFNQDYTEAFFKYTWKTGNDMTNHFFVMLTMMEGAWQILIHRPDSCS